MKRLIGCILLCCLLMGALLPPALAAGVSQVMCVTNCQEWVSLREGPDTSAKRLAKVRLGELVTYCSAAENDFIQCQFGGKTGYIGAKYLKTTEFEVTDSFPGNQMVVNCSEWVSLWSEPSNTSTRLTKVPLGSIVTACVVDQDPFIYCEYKGKQGYISKSYLKKANYDVSTQDTKVVESHASDYPAISGPMTVVNCSEWVSLREKPSTSAARLAKVPLGTQVTDCVQVSDSFIYCRYNKLYGYIHVDYLSNPLQQASSNVIYGTPAGTAPSADTGSTSFNRLSYLPSLDAFKATGDNLLTYTFNGYTIVVQKAYNDWEEIMAVCYNANLVPLWQVKEASTSELSDVEQTDAFIAGTAEKPLLVIFVSGKGLIAYNVGPWAQIVWSLPESPEMEITNSIETNVDADGTIYIAFDDTLLAVSNTGALLWKTACNDPDIYWPYRVDILENQVEVFYENDPNHPEMSGVVIFGKDGGVREITQREVSRAVDTE